MLYAIYAYEETFGGLHGINSYAVIEASSQDEAEIVAAEMSRDIIDSYEYMLNLYDEEEDDEEDYIDAVEENIAYEVYPFITETTKSLDELNDEFQKNPNEILEKYCGTKREFY